jgi:GTPase
VNAPVFVDECSVFARAGDGGDGSVTYRREAHVPLGGPDGGDGGDGGSVVLVADRNVTSLVDLHRAPHLRAGHGGRGGSSGRTGARGDDREVSVPLGTVVRDEDGDQLADLDVPGRRVVIAAGGRGGRGNRSFANRFRRVPTFAERGEGVEELRLRLELRLIADVGLVGYPSAGKSSLVRRLSAATPRVEAWPFTTLTPHLGVMRAGDRADGSSIDVVLADVPGLIEGASEGRGLGTRFLRHVSRCRVILHVLDAAALEPGRDPEHDLDVVLGELHAHDPGLASRRQLVVLNKVDLADAAEMAAFVRPSLEERGFEVLEVSAMSGAGLDALRYRLGELVEELGPSLEVPEEASGEAVIIRPRRHEAAVRVEPLEDGAFQVISDRVERWVAMLPVEIPDAARYLQGRMRRAGVERALVAAGARVGDTVVIGGVEFVFRPELDDLPPEEREAVLAGESDDLDLAAGMDEDLVPFVLGALAAARAADGDDDADGDIGHDPTDEAMERTQDRAAHVDLGASEGGDDPW